MPIWEKAVLFLHPLSSTCSTMTSTMIIAQENYLHVTLCANLKKKKRKYKLIAGTIVFSPTNIL